MIILQSHSNLTSTGSYRQDCDQTQHHDLQVLGFGVFAVAPTLYPDGEIAFKDLPNTRGQDVMIYHTFQPPVTDAWARLFFLLSAIDAKSISLLAPYLGFGRSHSARGPQMLKELHRLGVSRLITFDYHRPEFLEDVPLDVWHLSAKEVFIDHVKTTYLHQECVVVAPDSGSLSRASKVAKGLNIPLVTLQKQRHSAHEIEMGAVAGDVAGKTCLIFDDMIATGATLVQAAEVVKKAGAQTIVAYCTHGLFLADAIEKIETSLLDQVVVTETLELSPHILASKKISTLSVMPSLCRELGGAFLPMVGLGG